jgi:hypothetical protein
VEPMSEMRLPYGEGGSRTEDDALRKEMEELWLAFGRISQRLDALEEVVRLTQMSGPSASGSTEPSEEDLVTQDRARIEELRRRVWETPEQEDSEPSA